jgi:flagellar hook-associated protein 3 FlgL
MTTDRITSGMMSASMLGNLNNSLAQLDRTSEEMSSGKSILEPSDNPYGASRIIELQSQLDGLGTYATNAQEGTNWENTAGASLSSIASILARVREMVVQGSNGTYNQVDLKTLGSEVTQLTEAIKQDANTQYANQYVFAGTATSTSPYQQGEEDTYHGNSNAITRVIGPGSTVTINPDLASVLGNGQASGDGKVLDTLRTIAEHLNGGTPEDIEALRSTDLENIETGSNALTALQATNGAVTNQLEMATTRIEGLQGVATASLSGTEDANLAQVAIAFSNEQAGYQAALRAGATIMQESLLNFLH